MMQLLIVFVYYFGVLSMGSALMWVGLPSLLSDDRVRECRETYVVSSFVFVFAVFFLAFVWPVTLVAMLIRRAVR